MDDAAGMRRIQRIGDLNSQGQQFVQRQRLAVDVLLQRHSVEELHGDEGLAIVFIDFVNGADVGMVQGRGGLRLALKAAERLLVFGDIIG